MNRITIDKFIDSFNNLEDKSVQLFCEGIITTNIKIEQAIILKSEDYLEFYNNEKQCENVKINIHQIMKIDRVSNNSYLIKFDGLQTVKISLF